MRTATTIQPTVDDVPTSVSFATDLKTRICKLLSSSPLSFGQLVLQMEGAYPTDIRDAIQSLHADNIDICLSQAEELTGDEVSDAGGIIETPVLPEPHPLDYDWRFTDRSRNFLSRKIAGIRSERIAILGAPTLYVHLAKANVDVALYDNNAHLVEKLQSLGFSSAIHCDLFKARFVRPTFDTVVADPPWYPEHYASFIRSSAELLISGGILFLSVLPRLTRPSASNDRMDIIRQAYANGFDIIDICQSSLAYDSPPFEQAALQAEGIMLKDWRRGDLFVFTRSTRPSHQTNLDQIEEDSIWMSFSVGKTIVKIRRRNTLSTNVEFHSLSPSGDVHLHSVSRRAPFRPRIDVWNSRNLALWMSRPDYLCDILEYQKRGGTFESAISQVVSEKNLSDENRETLRKLVNLLLKDAEIVDNA